MKAPEIVDLANFIDVGRPRPPEFRPAGVVDHEILCRRRERVVLIGPGDRIEQAFAQPIVEMKLRDQRGERGAAGQVGRAADAIGEHRRKARQRRAELCPSRDRTNETGGLLRRIAGKAETLGIEIARAHRGHDDGGSGRLGRQAFPNASSGAARTRTAVPAAYSHTAARADRMDHELTDHELGSFRAPSRSSFRCMYLFPAARKLG